MEKNFREIYQLQITETILSQNSFATEDSLEEKVNKMMKITALFGNIEIRKNNPSDNICFSTDSFYEDHYDSLILKKLTPSRAKLLEKFFPTEKNPLISLAYFFVKYSEPKIKIKYIQSTNYINPDKYAQIRESLHVNPHEFLLAQFLFRISSVLDKEPETKVTISTEYLWNNAVYFHLRDRFLDKKYNLNPNKERVIQILGQENAWLKNKN